MPRMIFLVVLCASAIWAQTGGSVSGTVVDPDNAPVPNAQVQATNTTTKATYKATADSGRFSLTSLPPGKYDISITAPGFNGWNQNNLSVTAAAPLRLDVHMLEYQLGTLGDGREFQIDRTSAHPAPSGPAPRTADGKPDLSGVWYTQRPIDPGKPEPLPWAQKLFEERAASNSKDSPGAHCLPRGITNAGALFPFKLVQTPTLLVMIFEDDVPSHRQVFLDGRPHPKDADPKWMGHSVGHWEGDTLVIDTVGFDARSWLDAQGHPHTEMMHVIERFHRPDLGHLEIEFTIDDPGAYKKPWIIKRASDIDLNDDVGEYVCSENEKDAGHLVGK
ncbi:MAG TPA: carboxypeptidase-like regulatory domain-containing protein [Bryobacteraceae bacterium]|nr:carboxypeptidase-like regulatory domain-containing protein [Bryobacteraceae bacterium]